VIMPLRDRLVYQDRIQNLRNAIDELVEVGLVPAIIDALYGFGENNRKLLMGTRARVPKGSFEYPQPAPTARRRMFGSEGW
jgi:hypothetical protein